jgi:hypothetical protein
LSKTPIFSRLQNANFVRHHKCGQKRQFYPGNPSFTLSSLKKRKLPAFFSRIFLNTPIFSGELYPQHRRLLQAMGLNTRPMAKFDLQNQAIHGNQAQYRGYNGCSR